MATFSNEDQLPNLPLPKLNQTVEQVLSALKPLITADEYANLSAKAVDFLNSEDTEVLQLHLKESSKLNNNYLNSEGISPTTSNVYGDLRGQTLPRNPFFILEDDPLKNFTPSQEFRAAILTSSALRFIVSLRTKVLKPDVSIKNEPLTMSSYNNIFGTTVVPFNNGVDVKHCNDSRHIVIMSNSKFYSLEVLSDNNQIWFSKHELTEIMREIIADSFKSEKSNLSNSSGNPNFAIGSFTTELKSTWKNARFHMEKTNPNSMKIIDGALFVVCLDNESPSNDLEKIRYVAHGTSRINSNGYQIGTCTNRYYDKLNIVVTKNSVAACIYPASIIDGTSVLRFVSDIYTDSVLRLARMINGKNYTLWNETNTVPINNKIEKPAFKKIAFNNLTTEILNGLHLAESRLADTIHQHEYISKKFLNVGKNYIKDKMNLPIDSFIQVCIQVTYYALYGKNPSTFEPVSTRKFIDARTEPISVQSDQIFKLCQSFISNTNDIERWNLFLLSINEHKSKIKSAQNGNGFERHLSALRSAFIQQNILYKLHPNLPRIRNQNALSSFLFDPSIEKLYKPELLVANCGNPALDFFGITPSIPSGFGLGYIVKDDYVTIVGSSQWRQTSRFLDTLERVFEEIKKIWKAIILSNSKNVADDIKRNSELKSYIDSIPMSMIESNNSLVKPNLSASRAPESISKGGSKKGADSYILGGYDYFDVEQLNIRSEFPSTAHSRVITRENSEINLKNATTSFKNIGNQNKAHNIEIGRQLIINQEF